MIHAEIVNAAVSVIAEDADEAEHYRNLITEVIDDLKNTNPELRNWITEVIDDLKNTNPELGGIAEMSAFQLAHDFQLSVSHYGLYVLVTSTLVPIQMVRFGITPRINGSPATFMLDKPSVLNDDPSIKITKADRSTSTAFAIMEAILRIGKAKLKQQGVNNG